MPTTPPNVPYEPPASAVIPQGNESQVVPSAGPGAPAQRTSTPVSIAGPAGLLTQPSPIQIPDANAVGSIGYGNLVPRAVLSRGRWKSYVMALPIAGLATYTLRTSYWQLKMPPGFRGLIISDPAGLAPITVSFNSLGVSVSLATGILRQRSWLLPVFMASDGVDLTLIATGGFSIGATAMLTTEEQIPMSF